jgi:soluble lytic murein transglycosylase-like protein
MVMALVVAACACVESSGGWIPPAAPVATVQAAIRAAAHDVGVPPALVLAIAWNESGLQSNAVSSAGAVGVMQTLPGVAAEYGCRDPYDAYCDAYAGARILAAYRSTFHGNVTLTVAAYNAGPATVERFAGIPPYAETRRYVADVLATYRRYSEMH